VEVDCSIDCFSSKDKWRRGVNYHGSCSLADGLDHVFGNAILMMSVGMTWCCAPTSEHLSESVIVIFSTACVAPKSYHIVSHGVNSGLKGLVG
jgi:hypothetical protein